MSSTYLGGTGNDGLNTSQKLKRNYIDEVRGEIDIDKNNNIYLLHAPTLLTFQLQIFQKTQCSTRRLCFKVRQSIEHFDLEFFSRRR